MKRILAILSAGFLLSVLLPHGAWALGVKDIVAMSRYGVPDSLIIEKIRHSDKRFDLNAKDLYALNTAGVSDDVVMAMLRTEDRGSAPPYYSGRYRPYDPQWYVGLDLGYYAPYHRAYAPIHMGRGFGYRNFERGRGYGRR